MVVKIESEKVCSIADFQNISINFSEQLYSVIVNGCPELMMVEVRIFMLKFFQKIIILENKIH